MSRQVKRANERAESKATKSRLTKPAIASIKAEDLTERQIRGWDFVLKHADKLVAIDSESTLFPSLREKTRIYTVVRRIRNIRGTLTVTYTCNCQDYDKNGRVDCEHIFGEKVRRKEVRISGKVESARSSQAKAERRPARKRKTPDGRAHRTAQRTARQKMPKRVPELVRSLKEAYDKAHPLAPQSGAGRPAIPASTRAVALILKVSEGASADEMVGRYGSLIENGLIRLTQPPHPNSISRWMNDDDITPVLREFLRTTTIPFRACENSCIIDSSKMSQMMSAHSRWVTYEGDVRDRADWMKCHALVGVETLVVMALEFSGTGSHDINFIKSLVNAALEVFDLKCFLGDKAYLAEEYIGWLWERGIRAIIPVKKKWDLKTKVKYYEACEQLVRLYDDFQAEFHEFYRLRPKIESWFSLLKRLASGYCWSRGRTPLVRNSQTPCTAWVNETLCKAIYMNLRTTTTYEESLRYTVNYLVPERAFPKPSDPLIAA